MIPYIFKTNTLTIGSYGLMLAIAYLIGRWYFLNSLSKSGEKVTNTELLIILLLASGVIGAKLMFILKNPDKQALLFSGTGFSSQGAILGAIIATYLFSHFNKIKLNVILDNAAPAAILAYAIARMGCFLSGDDCYGIPTNQPWGMRFPNGIEPTSEKVHPLPLYEIIYSIGIFIVLITRKKLNNKPYNQFFTLLGLWGCCRFLIEFLSTNDKVLFNMSGSQIGALIMTVSYIAFSVRRKRHIK